MTVPRSGRGWRLAPALIAMEAEADRIAPRRRRTSDGSIGDQAHASRKSDHNPSGGFVHALDLSHDPAGGFDAHARAREVARNVTNGVERRIKYIISNRQIFSRKSDGWKWRSYTGANGHTQHAHFSIEASGRNDTSPFFASVPFFPTGPIPPPYRPPAPTPPPVQPEEAPMAAEILVVDLDHPRKGQVWEFFGDRTRRMVPRAGNRANLMVMAAQAWGRKPLRIANVQQRSMMDVLFERYKDVTPPGDYDADRIPANRRG